MQVICRGIKPLPHWRRKPGDARAAVKLGARICSGGAGVTAYHPATGSASCRQRCLAVTMRSGVGAPACRQAGRLPAPFFDCVFGRGQATPLHPPIGRHELIRIAGPTASLRLSRVHSVELRFTNEKSKTIWCRAGACATPHISVEKQLAASGLPADLPAVWQAGGSAQAGGPTLY